VNFAPSALYWQEEHDDLTSRKTPSGRIKAQALRQNGAKKAPPKTAYNGSPPFDATAFLATIADGRSEVRLRARQTVFRQGEAANALYHIDKGRIRVTVTSAEGKQRMIALLGPGDFFGEGCLAGQPQQIATAAAIAVATVTRITKDTTIRLLRTHQSFAELFSAYLLARNIQIQDDLIDQLFNSSERRLARVLLLLSKFGADGSSTEPPIRHISQELLAERVGTTRARINAFMNKFRKLGYIEYNGTLKVHPSLVNVLIKD
jgi:CRP/FNR family transcriptional regulator, cyclic AMP receptor protein